MKGSCKLSCNGIDVSSSQGNINWVQVASSGIKFVIIRAGYGNSISQKDSQFDNNIRGALANNIKVGIYWFSYADSVQDAVQEANACNQVIASYKSKITMGVYFDWEEDSERYYVKLHGANPNLNLLINEMNVAFCNQIKNYGYKEGIYFNNDYKNNRLTSTTVNMGYRWFAYYSGNVNMYDIQQTSNKGHVNGISNAVDLDVCYNNNLIQTLATQFRSDTSGVFNLMPNSDYTFKITANGYPDFKTTNGNMLKTQFVEQKGNDYFIKVISTNSTGQVGIEIGNTRIATANIGYLPFKSDTTGNVNVKKGQSYTVKITCAQKPTVGYGTGNVCNIDFIKQIGSDWFFKITTTGNIGSCSGIFINGGKQSTFRVTVIA